MVTADQWRKVPVRFKVPDANGKATSKILCQCGTPLEYTKSWERHARKKGGQCLEFFNTHVHGKEVADAENTKQMHLLLEKVALLEATINKLQIQAGNAVYAQRQREIRNLFYVDPPYKGKDAMETYKKLINNRDERQFIHYCVTEADEAKEKSFFGCKKWYYYYLRRWMEYNGGVFYKIAVDNENQISHFVVAGNVIIARQAYKQIWHMIRRISTIWYQRMLKGLMCRYNKVFLNYMMDTCNTRTPHEFFNRSWPDPDGYFDTEEINDLHEVYLEYFLRKYYDEAVLQKRIQLKAELLASGEYSKEDLQKWDFKTT